MSDFKLFIDGKFLEARSGETTVSSDPSTGEAVGVASVAGPDDAAAAVDAAAAAFADGRWSGKKGTERAAVLRAVAKGIRDRGAELAELESRDSGATITKSKGADVGGASFWFRTMADYAERLDEPDALPQTMTPGPSYNYVRHEPVGVASAIIPWNFPLQMAAWKVSTALAAGCSMVLKPAIETPASASILASILQEAGVPDGVVNILAGPGPGTGEELVTNKKVAKVSFTGSTAVGRRIMALAAPDIKNVTLELGGKSAQVVLPDADLDLAVDGALYSVFFHAGQACTAGTRLLLPDEIHDEFMDRLMARVAGIRVGMALDPTSNMGPLINKKQFDTVMGYIQKGKDEGARLVTGGERLMDDGMDAGYFIGPTIFGEVTPEMTIAREEIFGPVLAVLRYDDVADAVRIANDSDYGLAGAVWGSPGKAMKVAHQLQAGTVWVNDYHLINPQYPFGGHKQSGIGREHGWEGVLAYTEAKHVHVAIDAKRAAHPWFDMTIPRER